MLSFLALGFTLGMAHAFEADHVAAVSALVSGGGSRRAMLRAGLAWGAGHTLSLLCAGGLAILVGRGMGATLSHGFEFLVGLMLLGLGSHVLYRLRHDRVHFHRHTHSEGRAHLHLHSHHGEGERHDAARHRHRHPDPAARRSLIVGIMHGLAGSAALVVAAAAGFDSAVLGLAYIALFGIGSILGMGTMTAALSLPLAFTARRLSRLNTGLQLAIGVLTIGIGIRLIATQASALLG